LVAYLLLRLRLNGIPYYYFDAIGIDDLISVMVYWMEVGFVINYDG